MRWPWKRRKGCASEDAECASKEASRALQDAISLGGRVSHVAAQLHETKERNHFAAAIAGAIKGV
jgi:hypothetical protein